MNGYCGQILRVNLTSKEITTEPLDPEIAKKFIGGRGLGTYFMSKEVDPTVDALSPENKFIVATGPLTGSPAPTASRYMVVTKSPLSGTIASSNSGGFWGPELKFAGYDAMIVEGKSDTPCYIAIRDDKIEICDASKYWGSLVAAATDGLLEEFGDPKARVMLIGPAGEKLSPISAVMNEKCRAAGRSGVGAVMGSKNLKAVVVRGSGKVQVADSEKCSAALKDIRGVLKEHPVTGGGLPTHGTAVLVNIINSSGVYPTRNFQEAYFPPADQASGEVLTEQYLTGKDVCFRCPIGCGRVSKADDVEGGGPEYETIWAYTADCAVDDMAAVIKANMWCNEYGLDTISAGATIACAMEMNQRGLLSEEEMAMGPPLEFGSGPAVIEWTRLMGIGEGLAGKMAQGSYRLAESYGAPELSMTVKKLEMPAYDPRGIQGQGLQYATSNRGGCHVRGYMISPEVLGIPEKLDPMSLEGKPTWAIAFQNLTACIDSLGICLFTSFALGAEHYASMYNTIIGGEVTADDLVEAGDRIWNIERVFNLAAGIDPSQDTLPKRLLEEPIPEGASKGAVNHLDQLLPLYYAERGWSTDGIPTDEKLQTLGLK
ncbi:MAG: aldehyde ferredoxin oxidoreductase family protein [Phycisphaerales bacterium]|jgi:aldehyde:ferredoxin oxidoreductase|nr:aldehyde ferredoxin oxidoreductase family protein [Phycisphaerales bacterium]